MLYFAYGSNMSYRRLQKRVPSAVKLGVGILARHRLCFHKVGRDSSAKCDACESGDPGHTVYGVVYTISPREKHLLDTVEGVGSGYDIKEVTICMEDGNESSAFTYYATHVDFALNPMDWYKQHVIHGALENDLPDWYVSKIAEVACVDDHDQERRGRELSIYGYDAI